MQSGFNDSSVLDYSRIPPRLKDLLRREVCLLDSKEQIEAALIEFNEEHREVQVTRPPFFFMRKSAVKEQFNQRLSETRNTVEALQKGASKLTELLPRLHVWIFEEIERYLLTDNSIFLNGLAKYRFPVDWARMLKRFEYECQQFASAVDQLHQAVSALQPEQRLAGQLQIMDMVKVARARGARMDLEILTLNRISILQKSTNPATALIETPVMNCETQSARVAMIDDINTRDLLARFIARFKQNTLATQASFQKQVQIASTRTTNDVLSYVESIWDIWRSLAVHEINPAQMERLLIETERMLEKHEQA